MEILKLTGYAILATIAAFGLTFLYDYDVKLYYFLAFVFSLVVIINLLCKLYYRKSFGNIIKQEFTRLKLFTHKLIDEIEDEEELLA